VPGGQGVAGSNPAVPTKRSRSEGVPGSHSGPFSIFGSQPGSHLTPVNIGRPSASMLVARCLKPRAARRECQVSDTVDTLEREQVIVTCGPGHWSAAQTWHNGTRLSHRAAAAALPITSPPPSATAAWLIQPVTANRRATPIATSGSQQARLRSPPVSALRTSPPAATAQAGQNTTAAGPAAPRWNPIRLRQWPA
jgi:hypothetical protein